MDNPIVALRKKDKLNQSEFARLMGVSQQEIYRAEQGDAPSLRPKIREGLAANGYDVEAVVLQYEAWHKWDTNRIRKARADSAGIAAGVV